VADPRALLGATASAALTAPILPPLAAPGGTSLAIEQQPADQKPKLSLAAQAETDEKVAAVLRRYGGKLSDQQKADVRRLLDDAQTQIEALRAYPLENSDEPATILHLEMTSARRAAAPAKAVPAAAPGAAKKPAGGA